MTKKRTLFAASVLLTLCCLSIFRSSLFVDESTIWEDTVAKSPGKARPHNNLGHGYKLAHRPAEAMREFERALEISPDQVDALNNLATLYANVHRTEEAVAMLRRTLSIDPNHLSAHYNLAMNYYSMGLNDDAAQEYRVILQLAPESREALFARQMLVLVENGATAGH